MADATILPTSTESKFFYWANKPKLTVGLSNSASDTTLYWSAAPTDSTGATITGGFISSWTNKAGKTERIWVPASAVAADGLSATGCVRGIDPNGLDYTVGDTAFILELDGGSTGNCVIAAQSVELIRAALQNLIATGATGFTIGVNSVGTVTIYRATGAGTKEGFLRWNTGNSKVEYSNDGTTWNSIDSVSASNLLVVTNSDTTPSNLNAKTASGTGITRTVLNPGANETLEISVNGTLANLISDVTATATLINQALTGISANVTAANLNTLTAGASSNADSLHTHTNLGTRSYVAYEAISLRDAVCLLPVETKWYTQLTSVTANLGNSNTTRRRSVKYIPTLTGTLTDWNFRAAEAVNGATALGNLVVTIETDNAGAPSGTPLTNATATISQVTQRTWTATEATRTATFGGSVSFTAGTTYWVVYACSATDATNYLKFGCNDTYVNNYLTFTHLTYNLDTATWGSSTSTSIPFGWSNTTANAFGFGLAKCTNAYGAKTWNFIGFASAAISAQATGSVYTDVATLTGLTPNSTYYLSTAGAITTTAPQNFYNGGSPSAYRYKIGKSYSTTELKINLGPKRIWGTLTGTSTTISQIQTWFPPTMMTNKGAGAYNTSGHLAWTLEGIYDGTNNYSVQAGDIFSSGSLHTQAVQSTSSSFSIQLNGTEVWAGVGSAVTDAGLTYTTTKTGNGDAFRLHFMIEG